MIALTRNARAFRNAFLLIVGMTGLGLLIPSMALAHVTVNPDEAPRGGFTKLAFRVPNEREVPTVKLEVAFDKNAPIAIASVKPVPGWRAEITRRELDKPIKVHDQEFTEAIDRISWTAETPEAGIQVGQFQEFEVSAGPLPDADEVVFKALQTYADNEVVSWIEEQTGDEEPEHPAPVLKLVGEAKDHHDSNGKDDDDHKDSDTSAVAVIGLIAGLAGLLLAGFALWRTRR